MSRFSRNSKQYLVCRQLLRMLKENGWDKNEYRKIPAAFIVKPSNLQHDWTYFHEEATHTPSTQTLLGNHRAPCPTLS